MRAGRALLLATEWCSKSPQSRSPVLKCFELEDSDCCCKQACLQQFISYNLGCNKTSFRLAPFVFAIAVPLTLASSANDRKSVGEQCIQAIARADFGTVYYD